MAKVVHISPRPYGLSAEAKEELKRILGEGGRITRVSPTDKSPDQLVAEIRALQPDVIVMESTTPPHSRAVRSLRDEYPVLERRYVEQAMDPNWRQARNPEPRTSRRVQGYGIRNENGEVEGLPDNALHEHVTRDRKFKRGYGY